MDNEKRGAYVTWANFVGRSQGFIDNLDMIPLYIKKRLVISSKFLLPFRYLLNFVETLYELWKTKPSYVIVMCPPIFPVFSVFIFKILCRTHFIVDIHSGSFESRKWKWSIPVLKFLCKNADKVLVTNKTHFERVRSWGTVPMIVGDPPPVIPEVHGGLSLNISQLASPSIVVINTYSKNEALEEIMEAAQSNPQVVFYITGDKRKADNKMLSDLPSNVVLTGWIEINEFWHLLKNCNLVLTLIEQENTILRGGWEAMYIGQPLITSNTGALRDYFYKGTVFVDNTAECIGVGIQVALANEANLRIEMNELRRERMNEWMKNAEILRNTNHED